MHNRIDILMATYNGEAYLKDQIDSILGQTYQNFRLLIRDDGSTDSTREIIADFAQKNPSKIEILPSQQGLGAKGNFSMLMQHVQAASYVMFSDQDDVWMPHKISKTLEAMQAAEHRHGTACPILVHTDLVVSDHQLATIHPSFFQYTGLNPRGFDRLNRLLIQNIATGCTLMLNRALLQLASPIPSQAIMHDWWIALVASGFGVIRVVPQATMHYRQHQKNTIGAKKFSLLQLFLDKIRRWRSQKKPPLMAHDLARLAQAEIFYKVYQNQLESKQKKIVEACLQLKAPCWKNRYLMLKHRLFKSGFIRNFYRIVLTGRF